MADKDFIARVFQQATEEFDIEFNPVAWERMEKKLDRARRRRVLFYWLRWGVVALAGMLLAWLILQNDAPEKLNTPVTKPNIPVVEAPKTLDDPCIENQAIVKEEFPSAPHQEKETSQPLVNKNKLESNKERRSYYKDKKNTVQNNALLSENSGITLEKISINKDTQDIDFQTKVKHIDSAAVMVSMENIADIELTRLEPITPKESITINQPSIGLICVLPTKPAHPNRWVLGLSIAPETASVGFNNPSRLGYSLGILTEYRFARRFALSAQGVYAQKRYVAGKGAFNRPGGWLYGLEPIETSGNCNMLEATLSLRTELWQHPHWNLVATTGVSTWWMLREGYDYEYEEHYPGLIYYWESDQTLTHWLAMAQLGIGAEIKLSQKLSAQADIYLQVPLQGVGRGQVQLYSQGVAISLRRRF